MGYLQPPDPVRLRAPRATPLEIWQLRLASGGGLSRAIQKEPARILEGLALLHRGEGQTRDGRTDHHICAGYEHLVLGGGRAGADFDAILAQGPTPFTRMTDRFIGEAGGQALAALAGFTADETLVLDLGQTAIKVSYAGRRLRLPRDRKRLPRGRVAGRHRQEQRVVLCDFIAEALNEAIAGQRAPLAVVVGLPGEVGDDAAPGRSTYAGTEGYTDLLPDALVQVGLKPKMLGVLNDAELAAASAGLLPESAGKTLVLTLGFGLGAALLQP